LEIEAIAAVGIEKRHIAPPGHWNWRRSEPYSHGWRVGDIVFVGGQISADTNGALVGPGDISVQTANVFGNFQSVLRAAGADMSNLLHFVRLQHL